MIAALQFYHVGTGAFGELGVFIIVFLCFTIELLQIGQAHIAGVFVLHFFQIGNQHAELGTPVTHVVGADHFMPQEFLSACRSVTDNGGAQVTDVHFFRHVGR